MFSQIYSPSTGLLVYHGDTLAATGDVVAGATAAISKQTPPLPSIGVNQAAFAVSPLITLSDVIGAPTQITVTTTMQTAPDVAGSPGAWVDYIPQTTLTAIVESAVFLDPLLLDGTRGSTILLPGAVQTQHSLWTRMLYDITFTAGTAPTANFMIQFLGSKPRSDA